MSRFHQSVRCTKEKKVFERNKFMGVLKDNRGINTVEIIIILAVFIGLILLFKDYITEFLQKIFNDIDDNTDSILNVIMPLVRR